MTEIKVGDKVRYTGSETHDWYGLEGEVVYLSANRDACTVRVSMEDAKRLGFVSWEYYPYKVNLTVIPKLKVGDLVTFNEPGNGQWKGGKGKVDSFGTGDYPVQVEVIEGPPTNELFGGENGAGRIFNFKENHLELWEEPEKLGEPCDAVQAETSAVNHPSHYNQGKIEVIDAIEDWGLGFNDGNSVKYIARAKHKGNRKQDIEKAIWYLQRELASL